MRFLGLTRRGSIASAVTVALVGALLSVPAAASAASGHAPVRYNNVRVKGALAGKLKDNSVPASSVSVSESKPDKIVAASVSGVLPVEGHGVPISTTGRGHIATATGGWKPVGSSGVSVGVAVSKPIPRSSPTESVRSVDAKVLAPKDVKAAGLKGLVLSLHRTDHASTAGPIAVQVPNDLVRKIYGADFQGRIRWVQYLPGTKGAPRQKQTIASTQDPSSKATILTPTLTNSRVLVTAASAPSSSSGTGNYAATPLSASALWDVSEQTGDFTWRYPLRIPPAAAGPVPDLSLSYDAQSVDGKTGSTNNQTSAVGEGWNLSGGGFIERSYVSCAHDDGVTGPVTSSGDLCWKADNATVAFAGHGGGLVRDSSSAAWRLQSDDGSRVEHLVGAGAGCASNGTYDNDCWRITTTDGTQYYFGLNHLPGWSSGSPTTNSTWTVPVYGNDPGEPCHAATFTASSCAQAWRWNLDYVVDPHGNAEALYYNAETNKYSQNGGAAVSYVRGGQLDHIDYGFTTGDAFVNDAASGRVSLTYSSNGRCSDVTGSTCSPSTNSGLASAPTSPSSYPDVPFDQLCTSACPTLISPTFWTNGMLDKITTSVLKAGSYANVDSWAMSHSFPDPGDGTAAALWLAQVTHTGYAGAASLNEPPTVFTGVPMQNRVWPTDGLAPLDKYRISSIATSSGGVISVNYSAQECSSSNAVAIEASPQSNTMRCFPQWWSPDVVPPQASRIDLFHKYVVTSVISDPRTGGGLDHSLETQYVYTGTPAWRYDTSPLTQSDHRTWSIFAGYDTIEVRTGPSATPTAQEVTDYTFYRGLDGDRAAPSGGTKSVSVTGSSTLPDSLWFAGTLRSQVKRNGVGGPALTTTTTTPWASAPTASDGPISARLIGTAESLTVEPVSTGGTRTTDVLTTNDATTGLPLTVSTVATGRSSTCTTTSYAPANTAAWIVGLPSQTATVSVDCADAPGASLPAAAVSNTRTSYDGAAWGTAPTKGDVTKTEVVDSYSGSTAHWVTVTEIQYDSMGRPTQGTDAMGHVSKTDYTPAAGAPAGSGPLTSIKATAPAPFNWTTTTTLDPSWGVEVSKSDANSKVTTTSYDALGRRVGVWYQDRAQATYPNQPSVGFGYGLSNTAPNWVSTSTLTANVVTTSYSLYDGLGRSIQAQSPAEGGGTVVSDQMYDGAGRVNLVNASYWAPSVSPSGSLFVPTTESEVPSETLTQYDGAGRPVSVVLYSLGAERHRSTADYQGADRVDTIPPAGGTPTSQFTDVAGQQVKLVQYLTPTMSPTAPSRTTSYDYDVSGNMTKMTDPAGNAWSWQYDLSGRLVSSTDPDRGTTTNTYDRAGNVVSTTEAKGTTLAYSYDAIGRQTAKYKDSTSGPLLASWTYDTLAKGQPTSARSYVGSTAGNPGLAYSSTINGYDAGYRATSSTISIPSGAPALGGTSYTTTFGYYASGAVATVVYPAVGGLSSERLRYSYNSKGKTSGLFGLSSYASVAYTAIGQPTEYQRNGTNSLFTDYGYDAATGALLSAKATVQSGSTFTEIRNSGYAYDEVGNVRSISSTSSSASPDKQCFGYDGLQNLASAWTPGNGDCAAAPSQPALGGPAPYWNDYTVSPDTGNRLSVIRHSTTDGTSTTEDYSYPAAGSAQPHAVQSMAATGNTTSTTSYTYDANGSTVTRPDQTLSYDAEGRLSTLVSSAGTQTNIYDANGGLLLQVDPTAGATLFLGDTQLRQAAGSSTVTAQRTYSVDGAPVAERSTKAGVSGSTLTWLAADAQGTVGDQVDSATGAVATVLRDPFGQSRTGSASSWSNGRGFLNAPTNSQTGLTQLGIRQYDSALGRFLTVDPVLSPGNPQQNNGYSYSANNPVTYSDPSGACFSANHRDCADTMGTASTKAAAPVKPAPAAKKAAKKQEQWWNPFSWSSKTWQNVGAVASGVVVGLGVVAAIVGATACTAVTFGVCGVVIIGAAVAAGAAGAAVTYGLQSGSKSAKGMAEAVGWGAVGGAAGAGAGVVIGKIVGAVASKVVSGAGAQAASRATAGAAADTAKGVSAAEKFIGQSRTYIDLTKGGSVRNVGTNTTRMEFAETLSSDGWSSRASKDGLVQIFERDGSKYILREKADSYSGWTADFNPAGSPNTTLKLRLGYSQ